MYILSPMRLLFGGFTVLHDTLYMGLVTTDYNRSDIYSSSQPIPITARSKFIKRASCIVQPRLHPLLPTVSQIWPHMTIKETSTIMCNPFA